MIIAATPQHSAQTIAFNEVGRTSIMGDPNWKNGDYDKSSRPEMGLAVARMMAHITYPPMRVCLKNLVGIKWIHPIW